MGLKFERIRDFRLIPKRLLKQVKPALNIDLLYKHNQIALSNLNLIYLIFVNGETAGFFWGSVNNITKTMFINILSVDKQYQGKKYNILQTVYKFVKAKMPMYNCDKFQFLTTRPKAMEKHGFVVSKSVLMEG